MSSSAIPATEKRWWCVPNSAAAAAACNICGEWCPCQSVCVCIFPFAQSITIFLRCSSGHAFLGFHSLQSSNLQRVLEDYFLALFFWRCFSLGFPFSSELKFAMGTWRAYENPWKWKLTNIRHGIGTLRLTLHKDRFFAFVDHASALILWIFTDGCCSLDQ